MLIPYLHLQFNTSSLEAMHENQLSKEQAKIIREIRACLTLLVHGKSSLACLTEKLKCCNVQNTELKKAIKDLDAGAENAILSLIETIGSISTQFNIFIPKQLEESGNGAQASRLA